MTDLIRARLETHLIDFLGFEPDQVGPEIARRHRVAGGDIKAMLAISRDEIDVDRVERGAESLGLQEIWASVSRPGNSGDVDR